MDLIYSNNRVSTVAITDYRMVSPILAKVVIAWTGAPTGADIRKTVTAGLKNRANLVESSFRQIGPDSAVGFVRHQPAVEPFDEKVIRAHYKVMGSSKNIMMDTRDRTLWQIKDGPGGKFLACTGQEQLAELIEAQVSHERNNVPSIRRLTMASAQPGEFAAWVGANGDMDYGYVTRSDDKRFEAFSVTARACTTQKMDVAVSFHQVPVMAKHHKAVTAALGREYGADATAYYREMLKLWDETGVDDGGASKSYTDKIVDQINSDAPINL